MINTTSSKFLQDLGLVSIASYKDVMRTLHRTFMYYDCVIAGGAAVELLYGGLALKDIDFFILAGPKPVPLNYIINIDKIGRNISQVGTVCVGGNSYSTENTDFNDRIHTCIKIVVDGVDVDIIISKCSTVDELLDSFDCNMNMVFMDSITLEPVGDKVNRLVFTKKVSDKRAERMLSKFRRFATNGAIPLQQPNQ